MRHLLIVPVLLLAQPLLAETPGERWLSHVKILADDNMEGRLAGTPGYDRAAAYVAQQFERLGLAPAGTEGFLQPVSLTEQSLDPDASRLTLGGQPLKIGEQLLLGSRVQQPRDAFDAELVFIGSGLHLPEAGHDDFADIDLKGKIVVTLTSGPKGLPGPMMSHARSAEFWPAMQRAGAIGHITIANPTQLEIPWERQKLLARSPGMRLTDPALNDAKIPFLTAAFSPEEAELLFAKSGRTFAEMVAMANSGQTLPRFALNQQLAGQVVARDRPFTSPNVVGLLPGRDRKLKNEYVVLTAHLDHLGVGEPVNGDAIYNGAMDNASGIASMIESVRGVMARTPRRSLLLVAVTAEERGLLGSRYFANRPTVPADDIVANINMDMYLPLWPFTHVTALGAEESSLGLVSARVAQDMRIRQVPDDAPHRNLFVRSDQYSFVRAGVPALALKFAPSTPEQREIQQEWLRTRYHAPSDNLEQPIEPAYAVAFNRYLVNLIRTVANLPERPTWNDESFFKRFANPPADAGDSAG